MPNPNLFSEFSATSKAEWLNQIEKDLKSGSISDLIWEVPPLSIDPFAHADDFIENLPPIHHKSTNSWEIGVQIEVIDLDFEIANKRALAALAGGANALSFIFIHYPTESQWVTLIEDIEIDFISVHFAEKSNYENPLNFLKIFHKIANDKGKTANILRGSVSYGHISEGKDIVDIIAWTKANLPLFKILGVDGGIFFKGSKNVIEELTETLLMGNNIVKLLINNNLSVKEINNLIKFNFYIGISYFIEIAKLRAFKLLWANVLTTYEPVTLDAKTPQDLIPTIFAYVSPDTQIENEHTNKIRATTQAMSAVLGGIDMLTIAPSDAYTQEASDFNQRIALNIQHILYMESYLDKVADPAAGCYYIEKLTHQIAETVWQRFQDQVS